MFWLLKFEFILKVILSRTGIRQRFPFSTLEKVECKVNFRFKDDLGGTALITTGTDLFKFI